MTQDYFERLYSHCTKDFLEQRKKARSAVGSMDQVDGYPDRSPTTILMALMAGLNHPNVEQNSAFDALVMLEDWVIAERHEVT